MDLGSRETSGSGRQAKDNLTEYTSLFPLAVPSTPAYVRRSRVVTSEAAHATFKANEGKFDVDVSQCGPILRLLVAT